ncbi:MAG: heavy-metal-associated domain-containing protein [Phycisphaerales bacterium]|nr:heavy-metal-associated domain-containing protein [Phycisphaerales bacterium]
MRHLMLMFVALVEGLGLAAPAFAQEALLTLKVPTLSCEGCRSSVEAALQPVKGVRAVDVNLTTKVVRVYMDEGGRGAMRRVVDALAVHDKKVTERTEAAFDGVRGVPRQRLAMLSRGVTLGAEPTPAADLSALRGAGILHVRLAFEPAKVWGAESRGLRTGEVAALKSATAAALDAGLGVVLVAAAADAPWARPDDQGFVIEVERMWAELAREMASLDPARLMFEVAGIGAAAPEEEHRAAAQRALVLGVREAAPEHTVVLWAPADRRGGAGVLANVVYAFEWEFGKTAGDGAAKVAAWGKEQRAPLYCRALGTLAPWDQAGGWTIEKAVKDLQTRGIGWATPGLDTPLGPASGGAGARRVEPAQRAMLGLTPAP